MSDAIPLLHLSGTPYEIGLAHGTAMRDSIRAFIDSVTAVHQANNTFLGVGQHTLMDYCMRNIGFLGTFSGDLVQELRGIADGAGVDLEAIVYLNTFLELEDLRAPNLGARVLPDALWGCTTVNVGTDASADGRAYIGQTFDMEKYYQKFLVLLHITPATGPAMLVVSLAGILGLVGLNAVGIGGVINKIVAMDARPGVIYPFLIRKAIAAERIGDALGTIIFSPRASGMNYQLTGSGVAFCAETSASHYHLLPVDGATAHTNHYVGEPMRRFETPNWLSHGGSMVRKQVADRFLRRHQGKLTVERLMELTCDHTNHPRCICAHGFPGEAETTAFHTIFGVVMVPADGTMDLCVGNPCQNRYTRYAL
ncbi:C45 family autoproteolytic acyltransferase/hydolase [Desulfosarcina ovata]|uniref:Peptidase C45 n=1 Tax=Desulfosarcina ovata subsp. ovata TaxID=2752305 RepID=A0A5K8AEW4_9BACT|nr:C45 family peptidase [Desulfosarcina ovata]BBO91243.1 peptidase C45 [Desulfosarcina ovata subsp. ovata]